MCRKSGHMWPSAPIHRPRPRQHVRPFWQDCETIPHNLPYKDLKKCTTHGCSFNNHLSENYYWNDCSSILLKRTQHAGAFLCDVVSQFCKKISIPLYTIGVFKKTFAETFLLLFCFSVTHVAWKTQTQLRKICKQSCTMFQKLMCARTQRSSEEAFHVFERNLTILRRSLPICGRDVPQMHFGKVFQIAASILKTSTV